MGKGWKYFYGSVSEESTTDSTFWGVASSRTWYHITGKSKRMSPSKCLSVYFSLSWKHMHLKEINYSLIFLLQNTTAQFFSYDPKQGFLQSLNKVSQCKKINRFKRVSWRKGVFKAFTLWAWTLRNHFLNYLDWNSGQFSASWRGIKMINAGLNCYH